MALSPGGVDHLPSGHGGIVLKVASSTGEVEDGCDAVGVYTREDIWCSCHYSFVLSLKDGSGIGDRHRSKILSLYLSATCLVIARVIIAGERIRERER